MWALECRLFSRNCACSRETGDRSCNSQREILLQFVLLGASLGALVPVPLLCHWALAPGAALRSVRRGQCFSRCFAGFFQHGAALCGAGPAQFGCGARLRVSSRAAVRFCFSFCFCRRLCCRTRARSGTEADAAAERDSSRSE